MVCILSDEVSLPLSCTPNISTLLRWSPEALTTWHARTLPSHHQLPAELQLVDGAGRRISDMHGRVITTPSPMNEAQGLERQWLVDLSGLVPIVGGFFAVRSAADHQPLACVDVVPSSNVRDSFLLVVYESSRAIQKEMAFSVRIAYSMHEALLPIYDPAQAGLNCNPTAVPVSPVPGVWVNTWLRAYRVYSHAGSAACDALGPELVEGLDFSQLSSMKPCVGHKSPGGVLAFERKIHPSCGRPNTTGLAAKQCAPLNGFDSIGDEAGAWFFGRQRIWVISIVSTGRDWIRDGW